MKFLPDGISLPFRPIPGVCLTLVAASWVSCEKPDSIRTPEADSPPVTQAVQTESTEEPEPALPRNTLEVSETAPVPSEKSIPPEPAEASPPEPVPESPVLEVTENEKEKRIVVSGHLSSPSQGQILIDTIAREFPDYEVVDEYKAYPSLQLVIWGNRIDTLVLPLLKNVEDAHFHYDKGVTTIGGTVKKRQAISQLHNMTIYVMEAGDSRGIENNLKVKE